MGLTSETAAHDRLGCETVGCLNMGKGVFEIVEPGRQAAQLLGNAVAAGGLYARADIHDAQALQPFGIRTGESHAVAAAHGVAEQDEFVQAHGVGKAKQIRHESLGGVVSAGSVIGVATATLVDRIDVVVGAERFGDVGPDVGVATEAVQHHQGRLALRAPIKVVQVDAVGGDVAALGLHLRGHVIPPCDRVYPDVIWRVKNDLMVWIKADKNPVDPAAAYSV